MVKSINYKNQYLTKSLLVVLLLLIFENKAQAVLGGARLEQSEFPEVVRLWNEGHNLAATGTIVRSHVVLTAAHCYENESKPFIFLENKTGQLVTPQVFKNTLYS